MIPYPDIDPVANSLGPFKLRWYGLMYLAGFGIAWFLGRRRAQRPANPFPPALVDDLIGWGMLGLVLGARLGYVLFYNTGYFLEHPLGIFKIWQGGMSFHGGLIGVLVCLYLFARKNGLNYFDVSDFLVPLAPPGRLAGRRGNFINGELWGRATDLPWAMIFPDPAAGGLPRHPSQLYEGLLEGVVLFTILWVYTSRPRPRMAASALFIGFYGLFRILVEFVRQPDPQLGFLAFGWLTMGQVLSLPMILVGVTVFWHANRKARGGHPL